MSRTFALIPAAGKSSRMGKPKLSLPLGKRTVLECVLNSMKQAGIADRLVVVGPKSGELATLALKAKAHVFRLSEDTPDMQATVLQGLTWLETHLHPAPDDCWLLVPADHPTLNPAVIRRLLKARAEHSDQSIFIPTYDGKRGHPALIGWELVDVLRRWPAGKGLNRFFRRHPDLTCECSIADPEVLCDLDTPADYQRLLRRRDQPGPKLDFHPLTPKLWPDLEKLFGKRGACGGCWCMAWRHSRADFVRGKGNGNKRAFHKLVAGNAQPGILAYDGDEPIGWCAVAPRKVYNYLERSRVLAPVDDQAVWSITCLFVARPYRRQGVSVRLLKAAADLARQKGAKIVEGYPVEPYSKDMPGAFAWTGLVTAFQKAGFKEVLRRSKTRPIMRREKK